LSTVKQEVKVGQSNSDEVVVLSGLDDADMVYLSDPDGMEEKEIIFLAESADQVASN
jgi:HlyD family secretion protein